MTQATSPIRRRPRATARGLPRTLQTCQRLKAEYATAHREPFSCVPCVLTVTTVKRVACRLLAGDRRVAQSFRNSEKKIPNTSLGPHPKTPRRGARAAPKPQDGPVGARFRARLDEKFYEWLDASAGKVPTGPSIWICGDCQVGNLGPLADAEGQVNSRSATSTRRWSATRRTTLFGFACHWRRLTAVRTSGATTAHVLEEIIARYRQALAGHFDEKDEKAARHLSIPPCRAS